MKKTSNFTSQLSRPTAARISHRAMLLPPAPSVQKSGLGAAGSHARAVATSRVLEQARCDLPTADFSRALGPFKIQRSGEAQQDHQTGYPLPPAIAWPLYSFVRPHQVRRKPYDPLYDSVAFATDFRQAGAQRQYFEQQRRTRPRRRDREHVPIEFITCIRCGGRAKLRRPRCVARSCDVTFRARAR